MPPDAAPPEVTPPARYSQPPSPSAIPLESPWTNHIARATLPTMAEAPTSGPSLPQPPPHVESHIELILSLFPGAGILDAGFALAGFCVVRGPDILLGGHIETFTPPPGHFAGVIAGPPCQDFSRARRRPPTGHGIRMLAEFARCVAAASPQWWLIENVPGVPDVAIDTYTVQRFNILATEFGVDQRRNRCYQFGRRDGPPLTIARGIESHHQAPAPAALAHDPRHSWRQLAHLQGLPAGFDLPGLSRLAKIRAIGNGVPVPVAAAIAAAIRDRHVLANSRRCLCGCGRVLAGKPARQSATPACRKRLERARGLTAARSPQPAPSSIVNRQSTIDNCAPPLSA